MTVIIASPFRFGRVRAMFGLQLFHSIWWFIGIYSPYYELFVLTRFMVGAARIAAFLAAYIYSKLKNISNIVRTELYYPFTELWSVTSYTLKIK